MRPPAISDGAPDATPDATPDADPARDRAIARALARWYPGAARELPWRAPLRPEQGHGPPHARRDPYRSLVSEAMLQQTQVARVLEAFDRFCRRFPAVERLAAAEESAVLAEWAGLGYYRRARQLHAAAKAIVERHDARVPADPAALRALPGVGRYTAGAIASIVYGDRVPLVDGNVTRVLLRIEGLRLPHAAPHTDRWAWMRAEQLLQQAPDPGVHNEALMELGATVCTPSNPACDTCPIRARCIAHEQGIQATIPLPKKRPERRTITADVLLARLPHGQIAIEQRPGKGLWADMWQFPTIEHTADDEAAGPTLAPDPDPEHIAHLFGLMRSARPLRLAESFTHQTTHRTVRFRVWRPARPLARGTLDTRWRPIDPADHPAYPMSNPQRRLVIGMLP
ncbi:MAG: A/G-specific adenine glycosylase [Phycisphaerales bacterium]